MSLSALCAMEQYSQYLMWMKSKHILNSHFGSSMMNPFNNSWEEQAFADDAAGAGPGPLGGFIWPPRSYSCSFCKREFRSAQALGGHMNVHRRDRAKLKQSLTSPQQSVVFLHPSKSPLLLDASYPSQVCFLDSNPNPNPSFVASPHSPSRVSAITAQENLSEPTYVSPFSSSIVQEHLKEFPLSSPPPPPPPQSNSEVEAVGIFYDSDSKTAFEKNAMKENFETNNLSMGLDLVVSQNRPSVGSDCDDQAITSKRHKTNVSSMPFFVKPCSDSDDRYHFQSEVLGLKNGSLEDLDLELRLGDSPKVK